MTVPAFACPVHSASDGSAYPDWSPVAYEDGVTNPGLTYLVSKKYAELAALKFVEEQKPNFDLVVLNPYVVI